MAVTFALDNHYDGTATIYVENIVTPEEYGISQYNESLKDSVTGGSGIGNGGFFQYAYKV